jgi:hypothetical protein
MSWVNVGVHPYRIHREDADRGGEVAKKATAGN